MSSPSVIIGKKNHIRRESIGRGAGLQSSVNCVVVMTSGFIQRDNKRKELWKVCGPILVKREEIVV
jgi:hypothetical protein